MRTGGWDNIEERKENSSTHVIKVLKRVKTHSANDRYMKKKTMAED